VTAPTCPSSRATSSPTSQRLRWTADEAAADVEVLRLVADHVGQLTDDAAARLHRRLTGHVDRGFSDYR
jgi:dGTP triphosphohydrolase